MRLSGGFELHCYHGRRSCQGQGWGRFRPGLIVGQKNRLKTFLNLIAKGLWCDDILDILMQLSFAPIAKIVFDSLSQRRPNDLNYK